MVRGPQFEKHWLRLCKLQYHHFGQKHIKLYSTQIIYVQPPKYLSKPHRFYLSLSPACHLIYKLLWNWAMFEEALVFLNIELKTRTPIKADESNKT